MSEIVVGVDGGGSKTRVLVGTAEGEVLASAEGPKSAVTPGQAAHSADVIAELVTRALSEIAQPGAVIPRVLYCGVAGTGRDEERRRSRVRAGSQRPVVRFHSVPASPARR